MPVYQTPPPDLQRAIDNASKSYGVPADILTGIWHVESGSTYPNPAVNSSGYGGLFGTRLWNATTQTQANYAAKTLASLLRSYKGNIASALSAYSGGGYTSVPGQTTTGTHYPQAGSFTSGLSGVGDTAAGIIESPLKIGAVNKTAETIGGVVTAPLTAEKFLARITAPSYILRGLQIVAGAVLVLVGVVLLARQVGLAADVPDPVTTAAGAAQARIGAA